jgi:hypothetical protein
MAISFMVAVILSFSSPLVVAFVVCRTSILHRSAYKLSGFEIQISFVGNERDIAEEELARCRFLHSRLSRSLAAYILSFSGSILLSFDISYEFMLRYFLQTRITVALNALLDCCVLTTLDSIVR